MPAATDSSPSPDLPRHPVRVVARRTGLSTHVLRAWERRYGVVAPTRSDGGQRLYSDADIERLSLLRTLTAAGGAISQLAGLPRGELARLVSAEVPAAAAPEPMEDAGRWLGRALLAIEALDAAALRHELGRAALALGVPPFLDRVVAPLLREVGDRWEQGRMGIAQEHLATAVVREVLGWVRDAAETGGAAPVLVVGTPAGQLHEGGALLVAASAAAEGWRVVYLGVNLPGREIAAAARQSGARAVALSLIHPAQDAAVGAELRALRRLLPESLPVLVGGAAAPAYAQAVAAADGRLVPGLEQLRVALRQLAGPA